MDSLILLFLGVLMGGMSALLGLGGGVLVSPLLPFFLPISQSEAVATSLMTILLVVVVNSYSFHCKKLIDWQLVIPCGIVSAAGAFVAGHVGLVVDEIWVKGGLGTTLIVFSGLSLWNCQRAEKDSPPPAQVKQRVSLFLIAGVGLIAGMLSGFTGVGSGVILGPALLSFPQIANRKVVPSVNGIMIFSTFFGVLAYVKGGWNADLGTLGAIQLSLIPWLIIPAWGVSYFLRPMQEKIPDRLRALVLAMLLGLLGIRVMWSAYQLVL